ncbi:MAG: recombinase family protein [Clostridia bacterium]|nr:recombinase family protein [Clostridia bacterium]
MNIRQTEPRITALYERLSRDDELQGDSNSIRNQKIFLENYAKEHGFDNCVHYTDDGWSGGNFERPAWKQLIRDVEAEKVGAVIVKDMSRVGREYLQTGYYTEVVFRQHDVHFIAIGNNIDSDDQSTTDIAPFFNIMSEFYLRDMSKKQRAAYKARGLAGKPTTNQAIYGYRKDPEDKHHWLIDEEAAEIVRRIFQMAVNGDGPGVIASKLRDSQVETPSYYETTHGICNRSGRTDMTRPYDWCPCTVTNILSRPEYMGHTVNFRSSRESYKSKKVIRFPEEDWVIIENTHDAIIDPETWKLAQYTRRTIHRVDKTGVSNPFTGLVYCADCGAKMYNHRMQPDPKKPGGVDPETGLYPYDHYDCSTYTLTMNRVDNGCRAHYISTKALRALVLETIRLTSRYAIEHPEEFSQKVREASEIKQNKAAKELKKKIAQAKKRSVELDSVIKKLYESYAMGMITESRFATLIAEYEKEQAEVNALIGMEQTQLDTYEADNQRVDQFMALAKKYTDFTELTPQMIYEFIDRIIVHAPEKIDGERVQEVEIRLQYIGKFDTPLPDPTPEELEVEEKRRKRREINRRYNEKKKAKKLAAAQQESVEDAMAKADDSMPSENDEQKTA